MTRVHRLGEAGCGVEGPRNLRSGRGGWRLFSSGGNPALTPSGVSKMIARLEDGLGRRLLQRTSRSMRLTPEGENFLEAARRVLSAMEEAEAVGSTTPTGTLRIRCVPTFARYQLAPM